VPKDVQLEVAGDLRSRRRIEQIRIPKCTRAYDDAAAMIATAKRPMLYIGGGVVKARAEGLVRLLCEQASIPAVTTLMAMGTIPHDHELNLGMLGMHGSRATHHALEDCDLLIAIGARFDDRATGNPKRFVPNARIIHADIDAREFGKIKAPTLMLHADAWTTLTELLRRSCAGERREWIEQVVRWRKRFAHAEEHPHQPTSLVRAIGACLPSNTLITTDVGQHQMWVAQAFPFTRADRWLTSGGLGTMGFGLPAAIGALIAEPEAMAVCFTGDGSLLMNIQELATLAELRLPLKIVLFDNAGLGMVRQQQQLFYGQRYFESRFDRACDFVAIAKSFGIEAVDLDCDGDIAAQLLKAFAAPGPMLVRIGIGAHHNVTPMVGPGAANIDALDCA